MLLNHLFSEGGPRCATLSSCTLGLGHFATRSSLAPRCNLGVILSLERTELLDGHGGEING